MRFILQVFGALFALGVFGLLLGVALLVWGLDHYGEDLPDHAQLATFDPPTVTRVHAGDGRLLAEYAIENRVVVPIEAIPEVVIDAFLAAEDKDFLEHPGINLKAIARAVLTNLANLGRDRRPVGASTITQQVAKNFLLTNEVSLERKAKEAILALRIEKALPKARILDLYLNKIYLGIGSYGVASAALNYFNKSLDELTVAEAAFLAALPKAPNNYHPVRRHEAAVARRNWVIGRMLEDKRITADQAERAMAQPLIMVERAETEVARADYFAEQVRRQLVELYGEDRLYQGGLSVRTTLDPRLQEIAEATLRQGLLDYDRRHGWRGPLAQLEGQDLEAWPGALKARELPAGTPEGWRLAMVLETEAQRAVIGLEDGSQAAIPMSEMTWARPPTEEQDVGEEPTRPDQVLAAGDLILVEALGEEAPGEFSLRQFPEVNGGLVALDPHSGRVLALVGGFAHAQSEFDRAIQARRQPGSSFKPFVYLTALEEGLPPNTLVLDAPFVIERTDGQGKWKPANYTRRFYGPTPMRVGIENSRNLMTVRLARTVGMTDIIKTAKRFDIVEEMPHELTMALGSGETTLLQMTTAYAMLVNGGKRIAPSFIDRVQDKLGTILYRRDQRPCEACSELAWDAQMEAPLLEDEREQVADPVVAYQMVSMLEGVVQRGTGRRIGELGLPLAGKTGTTNDNKDTWFVGFAPDLAVGVFVGFDTPKTLGPRDTGSSVAAPIFKDFMQGAFAELPVVPFRVPSDIKLVRIDRASGRPARGGGATILEAFRASASVDSDTALIDGGYNPTATDAGTSLDESPTGIY